MQQPILVTGGTGFVGSYLLRYLLLSGYANIRATRRTNSKMEMVQDIQSKIEWVEADLLDLPALEEAMQGVSEVYHSAAMVSFNPSDARKMMAINEKGTENIVNLALYLGIKKLVHISSVAALGKEEHKRLISEKTPWKDSKKNSAYALSKYRAEMQVWRGMAEGLQAAIVNPSLILGSGNWKDSSTRLIRVCCEGIPVYPAGATGIVDVRDVCRMAVQLMESDITEERFIASGHNVSYQELFEQLAANAGVKKPSIRVRPWMNAIGWRLEWLKSKLLNTPPTLTKETARATSQSNLFDNQKSITQLGFQYTPLEQTLEETVADFLKSKKAAFRQEAVTYLPF